MKVVKLARDREDRDAGRRGHGLLQELQSLRKDLTREEGAATAHPLEAIVLGDVPGQGADPWRCGPALACARERGPEPRDGQGDGERGLHVRLGLDAGDAATICRVGRGVKPRRQAAVSARAGCLVVPYTPWQRTPR